MFSGAVAALADLVQRQDVGRLREPTDLALGYSMRWWKRAAHMIAALVRQPDKERHEIA
jgi:hypothetical protein